MGRIRFTRERWAAALLIAVSIMALVQAFPYMSQPVYGATLSHIFAQIAPFQTANGTTETGTTATGTTATGTTATGTTATGTTATGATATTTTPTSSTTTATTTSTTETTPTTSTITTATGTTETGTTATGTTATGTTATGTTETTPTSSTTTATTTSTTETSSTPTTYTTTNQQQYLLTMQPNAGGTTAPATGYQNANAVIPILATPNSGFTFVSWTGTGPGSFSGTSPSASATMDGPITETATFVPTSTSTLQVTVESDPSTSGIIQVDGSFIGTPQTYTWTPGTTHGLFATYNPSCNYNCQATFLYWTSPSIGTVYSQAITYTVPSSAETITAVYQITRSTVSITVASVPSGLNSIYVDGTQITTPQTFSWDMGSTHTLTASQYCGISGCQTQFSYWQSSSVGPNNAASFTYTVPTYSETVTAYYQTAQNIPVIVTETPTGSGTLTVDGNQITAQQTFYWTAGSTHTLSAQNGNAQFASWTSPSIGTMNANTITYIVPSSGETVTASYTAPASNKFLFAFGSYGSSNGQLKNPHFIAIDSSGNIYVTDSDNARVEKFDRSGNYITQWGSLGSGNGQFSEPTGIAVDSSGNVYVADSNNHRVEKFTSSGTYLSQFGSFGLGNGQFEDPTGIAVDSSGNAYVADNGTNRVQEFTSSGTYLTEFGSPGSGNGQFGGATGIAIDPSSGNIYVVDYGHQRVEEFTSSGTYVTQWGSVGSGNGEFTYPYSIAVDSSGRIYVTDFGNNRVEVFTTSGTYLTQFGLQGGGNGQFVNPTGVAIDSSGNVYVVDNANNRVEVFHP